MRKKALFIIIVVCVFLLISSPLFMISHDSECRAEDEKPAKNHVKGVSKELSQIINNDRYKNASWGIFVKELESGRILFELNADKMFVPASTTKIFSVYSAIETLGADYKFKTPVYRRGNISKSGVLDGDLILVASGDLTMGGRTTPDNKIAFKNTDHSYADALPGAELTEQDPLAGLNQLAKQVSSNGIREVKGDVIIDDRLFETHKAQDKNVYFILTPIMINDNLIDLVIKPAKKGEMAKVEWRPHTEVYRVKSEVKTVAPGKPAEIEVSSNDDKTIVVRGQIPFGSKEIVKIYQAQDPASFARSLFIEALRRNGVKVKSAVKSKNNRKNLPKNQDYSGFKKAAQLVSPPFYENAKLILKTSMNIHADMLPMLIAAANGKKTFEEGMQLMCPVIKKSGIDMNTISLSDAEGGTRSDRFTPRTVSGILEYISKQPYFDKYHYCLPILGVDGSLVSAVGKKSPAVGKIQAKTGSTIAGDVLNNRGILLSKSLAGYAVTKNNKKLIFAVYVNNAPVSSFKEIAQIADDIGRICELIYGGQI
ncbi:MAG: D-alanyl-D-alanine carboxypeptidase/D-alanyl-D-alanine-endopeptidase [Candidatus Eremiobacteraeota bacterium]|nr:D-alanyl-D-alanine carboxypeptidase/D-alanyl-D-alanine-endopeptidase [Candidatus Eremiobacteraeota bacterium]